MDEFELGRGAGQLGQRFGLFDPVDLAGERFLGALARAAAQLKLIERLRKIRG